VTAHAIQPPAPSRSISAATATADAPDINLSAFKSPFRRSSRLSDGRQSFDHDALPFSAAETRSSKPKPAAQASSIGLNAQPFSQASKSSIAAFELEVIDGPHSGQRYSLSTYLQSGIASLGRSTDHSVISLHLDSEVSER
jgi:hypothetical protein